MNAQDIRARALAISKSRPWWAGIVVGAVLGVASALGMPPELQAPIRAVLCSAVGC